jgi:hypothetical protein
VELEKKRFFGGVLGVNMFGDQEQVQIVFCFSHAGIVVEGRRRRRVLG